MNSQAPTTEITTTTAETAIEYELLEPDLGPGIFNG
jgi:hypothetical protein